jgi:hypothetical protein
MSDHIVSNEEPEQEFDEGEFTTDDYGFVIGPDGSLKSIAYPEDLMEDPPEEVTRILKIFGITGLADLVPRTLH